MSVSLTMVLAVQGMSPTSLPLETEVISRADCVSLCYYKKTCSSVFYDTTSKKCKLVDSVYTDTNLDSNTSSMQYLVWSPARTGGTGSCKAGYVYDETANVCYNVSQVQKTWPEAEDQCVSDGGHLIKVENNATNNLMNLIADTLTYSLWIGGNDIVVEDEWIWADGTSIKTTYWGSSALSTGDLNDCIRVKASFGDNRWSDADCESSRYFICQMPGMKQQTPNNVCQ